MTNTNSVTVKVVACIWDIECLDAQFGKPGTPADRYGLLAPVGGMARDNQGETLATIRMRRLPGWADGGRA